MKTELSVIFFIKLKLSSSSIVDANNKVIWEEVYNIIIILDK